MKKFELFRQLMFEEIKAKNSWGKNELHELFYKMFYRVSMVKHGIPINSSLIKREKPLKPIVDKPATVEIAEMLKSMNNILTPSNMNIINYTQEEVDVLLDKLNHESEKEHDFDVADNNDHELPWY